MPAAGYYKPCVPLLTYLNPSCKKLDLMMMTITDDDNDHDDSAGQ